MTIIKEIRTSLLTALWFMFLTFPLMVMKVNTVDKTFTFRWMNLLWVGIGAFFLSALWRFALRQKEGGRRAREEEEEKTSALRSLVQNPRVRRPGLIVLAVLVLAFPMISSMYQTSIMITALMYVILGLGLNIVVGFGGLLHLGYAAFYAVGAYSYALLNTHFGINFWLALPIGALVSTILGLLIGFPVLRLRGDYLAIVTLAFGEITRLVLENWADLTMGAQGIAQIDRPSLFGIKMSLNQTNDFLYYIVVALVLFTIFVIRRLESSRLGRAWEAMREDEIACQSMGIDLTSAKLSSFALGALWAGFVGVLFAAKTTYVNPASFTLWESVLILCVVVLGGMGSIPGVMLGALLMILLPEYLRAFSQYRMLIFGIALVLMMIFRPGGIIQKVRKSYQFRKDKEDGAAEGAGAS